MRRRYRSPRRRVASPDSSNSRGVRNEGPREGRGRVLFSVPSRPMIATQPINLKVNPLAPKEIRETGGFNAAAFHHHPPPRPPPRPPQFKHMPPLPPVPPHIMIPHTVGALPLPIPPPPSAFRLPTRKPPAAQTAPPDDAPPRQPTQRDDKQQTPPFFIGEELMPVLCDDETDRGGDTAAVKDSTGDFSHVVRFGAAPRSIPFATSANELPISDWTHRLPLAEFANSSSHDRSQPSTICLATVRPPPPHTSISKSSAIDLRPRIVLPPMTSIRGVMPGVRVTEPPPVPSDSPLHIHVPEKAPTFIVGGERGGGGGAVGASNFLQLLSPGTRMSSLEVLKPPPTPPPINTYRQLPPHYRGASEPQFGASLPTPTTPPDAPHWTDVKPTDHSGERSFLTTSPLLISSPIVTQPLQAPHSGPMLVGSRPARLLTPVDFDLPDETRHMAAGTRHAPAGLEGHPTSVNRSAGTPKGASLELPMLHGYLPETEDLRPTFSALEEAAALSRQGGAGSGLAIPVLLDPSERWRSEEHVDSPAQENSPRGSSSEGSVLRILLPRRSSDPAAAGRFVDRPPSRSRRRGATATAAAPAFSSQFLRPPAPPPTTSPVGVSPVIPPPAVTMKIPRLYNPKEAIWKATDQRNRQPYLESYGMIIPQDSKMETAGNRRAPMLPTREQLLGVAPAWANLNEDYSLAVTLNNHHRPHPTDNGGSSHRDASVDVTEAGCELRTIDESAGSQVDDEFYGMRGEMNDHQGTGTNPLQQRYDEDDDEEILPVDCEVDLMLDDVYHRQQMTTDEEGGCDGTSMDDDDDGCGCGGGGCLDESLDTTGAAACGDDLMLHSIDNVESVEEESNRNSDAEEKEEELTEDFEDDEMKLGTSLPPEKPQETAAVKLRNRPTGEELSSLKNFIREINRTAASIPVPRKSRPRPPSVDDQGHGSNSDEMMMCRRPPTAQLKKGMRAHPDYKDSHHHVIAAKKTSHDDSISKKQQQLPPPPEVVGSKSPNAIFDALNLPLTLRSMLKAGGEYRSAQITRGPTLTNERSLRSPSNHKETLSARSLKQRQTRPKSKSSSNNFSPVVLLGQYHNKPPADPPTPVLAFAAERDREAEILPAPRKARIAAASYATGSTGSSIRRGRGVVHAADPLHIQADVDGGFPVLDETSLTGGDSKGRSNPFNLAMPLLGDETPKSSHFTTLSTLLEQARPNAISVQVPRPPIKAYRSNSSYEANTRQDTPTLRSPRKIFDE